MAGKPLLGSRILITRPRGQQGPLQQKLEQLGAEVIAIPTIEIAPPDSYDSLDDALRTLATYDWLVLTSANAVEAMADRAKQLGIPIHPPASLSIAAIGNATADAIRALGLEVSLVPPRAVAESLAEALAPRAQGKRVLLLRAKVARDILPAALQAAGASVTLAVAYETIIPPSSIDALRNALLQPLDAVTFTSASSVHNFRALVGAAAVSVPAGLKKISIGPITTRALEENGWRADEQAAVASVDALVDAVVVSKAAKTE